LASWWALTVLLILALYTIADRPVINLQVEPLRKELGLSDFQIGLVQGVSVALITAVVAYPIAWLADRFDRRRVLAASIAVWCVALVLSGLARSFEELFIATALVGAGEAALIPIALAMIPELFRGDRRHLANSVLLVGGRLGLGAVIAMSGWLIFAVDTWRHLLPAPLDTMSTWRLALFAVALPGVVLVPLILTMPRQRRLPLAPRGRRPGDPGASDFRAPAPPAWPFLREEKAAFASFYIGIGMQSMAIGCVLSFAPVVAMRVMGATPVQTGNGMGAATLTATILGFMIAMLANRVLGPRVGPRLAPLALLAAAGCAAMPVVAMMSSGEPMHLFVATGAFLTMVMAGTLLYPTALQEMTPAPMRARLAALSLTANIVCSALGPAIVGALSDQMKGRPDGLLVAMTSVALVALVLSVVVLLPLAFRYPTTVASARRAEAAAQGA
jgi:MFS family permease